MSVLALFSFGLGPPDGLGGWVLRILGIIGAAAVGGFGTGLLVQVLVKLLTAQKVPRPVLQVLRVLGAVALGWLVAILLFQSGSGSGGFGGNGSLFGGKGKNGESASDKDTKAQGSGNGKAEDRGTLQIEVVGDKPDPEKRFYRLLGEKKRWALPELDTYLIERRERKPPVEEVVIVLYKEGGPEESNAIVGKLKDRVKLRLGMEPRVDKRPTEAPL